MTRMPPTWRDFNAVVKRVAQGGAVLGSRSNVSKPRRRAALRSTSVGCAGPGELLFKNAIVVDHLEGNYQVLARCTYEHLARQQVSCR